MVIAYSLLQHHITKIFFVYQQTNDRVTPQRLPRLSRMDGVKVALGNRGMMVEAAPQCEKDRKDWRALVHI